MNIQETGKRIAEIYNHFAYVLEEYPVTEEELKAYERYLQENETLLPLLDPTQYMRTPAGLWDAVAKRVKLIRQVKDAIGDAEKMIKEQMRILMRDMGDEE